MQSIQWPQQSAVCQDHVTDEITRDYAFELVDEAIELVIQCPAVAPVSWVAKSGRDLSGEF